MGRDDYRTTVYFYDRRLVDDLEYRVYGKRDFRHASKTDLYSSLVLFAIENEEEFCEFLRELVDD